MDRSVVKWGGLMGMVGAVLMVVLRIRNMVHHISTNPKPRLAGHEGHLQNELEVIANSGTWLLERYAWLIAIALVFFALITIAWSVADQPAASWMRWAAAATIGAGAIWYVGDAIGGLALEDVANKFAADPSESNLTAAVAVTAVSGALYAMKIGTFLGVVPLLFGVGGNASNSGTMRLAPLAIAGGVVGFLAGTLMHFEVHNNVVAGWMPAIATFCMAIWVFETCRRMWSTQTT